MRRVALALGVSFLSGCGGGDDESGPPTFDGECVYISTQHGFHDPASCADQGETLPCDSAELEDRSEVDRTVTACVYEGCAAKFDCEAFRRL